MPLRAAVVRLSPPPCFTNDQKDLSMIPAPWQPDRSVKLNPWPHPPMATAIGRGLLGRCPACGKSHLFNGFLRVTAECRNCRAPLGLARADDAPPYFTILLTGHVVVPLFILSDRYEPPLWLQAAIWLPLTLVMCLALLPVMKGAAVGLCWATNLVRPGSVT